MQANNRNLCKNKHSQKRNFSKSEDVLSCDKISNYPLLVWYKNLTLVKFKEWRLVFVWKVSQDTRLPASYYPIIDGKHCLQPQARYYQ